MDKAEALKAIKVLANVALESEDVEMLHRLLQEIIQAADNGLTPPPRS